MSKGVFRELERGVGRKMIKKRDPKKFWDDCIEVEAYIILNTEHGVLLLNGEVT